MKKTDHQQATRKLFGRAAVITATSLGLGILCNILFYGHTIGISFPVFAVVSMAAAWAIARLSNVRIPGQAYGLALPLLFFAGMVAVRSNEFVTFCNVMATLYLSFLLLYVIYRPQLPQFTLGTYLAVPFHQIAAYSAGARQTLAEVAGLRRFVRKHEHFPQIVRGIAIALPLLVIFTALFASADLVFRRYVGDLFSFNINGDIFGRGLFIAIATLAAMGALTYVALYRSASEPAVGAQSSKSRMTLGRIETAILFGSLNVLFLVFILVQLAYLFGGEHSIGQGYTYAQYARKGFFELIAVAAIAFVVIWAAERCQQSTARHTRQFRWLSAALVVQVLVIMVSAFKRLALYENAYGFTGLRFYSHVCIVWLAVVLCALLYKIIRDGREGRFALTVFMSVLAALIAVNLLNVDAFVARRNIARYHATGKLDVSYITSLSADAVPVTVQLLQASDSHVRDAYAGGIYYWQMRHIDLQEQAWQSKNLGRERARSLLQPQQDVLRRDSERLFYHGGDVPYRQP